MPTLTLPMNSTIKERRTATVSDLRYRFASLAKWIEAGEKVLVTRRGVVFAVLCPLQNKPTKPDWAARFKKRQPLPGKKLTKEDTQAFYDEMKGDL